MEWTRKIVVAVWVLLGVFLLAVLDWQFGGLRFTSGRANVAAEFVACWLPLVCVVLLGFLPRTRARLWAFVGLVPLAALCGLGGTGNTVGQHLFSPTILHQSIVRVGYSDVVVYYTNMGVLDDSGEAVVQQEFRLLPGLLWVKPLFVMGSSDRVNIKVINRHHIQCDYVVYSEDASDTDTVSTSEAKRDVAWVF